MMITSSKSVFAKHKITLLKDGKEVKIAPRPIVCCHQFINCIFTTILLNSPAYNDNQPKICLSH